MKKAIKRWLDRLAASNKENFGSQRLDCCKLGRETSEKERRTGGVAKEVSKKR